MAPVAPAAAGRVASRVATLLDASAAQAVRARLVTLLVAPAVFMVALDNGTYGVTDRAAVALALWWAVALGVALRFLPRGRIPRSAWIAVLALTLFAGLTGLSIAWSDSAEKAFTEVDRVLLYLGALALVVLCSRRGDAARWCDGLAIGISAIGVLALASGLYPDAVGNGPPPSFFPSEDRLLYPLNYWNGLAIFVGLAFPLLLRAAVAGTSSLWRALALAPVPALTATIYLTSSRGGAATAIVGVLAFVALTDRRLAALAATLLAGAGAAAAVAVLLARHALVDGPAGSAEAAAQADSAAIAIAVLAAAVGLLWWAWCRLLDARVPRHLNRKVGPAAFALCAVALLGGVMVGDPVQKLQDFRRPPQEQRVPDSDFTRAHLLDSNGSGRWQVWSSSYEQFEASPLVGDGAGSFEAWWAKHGAVGKFMRDAHSLFLETLGELGLIGLALVLLLFGAGFVTAGRRLIFAAGEQRATIAALAAVLMAFLVAANIDWMWELTAVGLVGIVALGLLVGSATQGPERHPSAAPVRAPLWWRVPWGAGAGRRRPVASAHWRSRTRIAIVAVAALVICLEGALLLSQSRLQDSRTAAERGDSAAAVSAALDARSLQPWASSPYLQLALLAEQEGDLRAARRWVAGALERDPADWRLWLVSARIETKTGSVTRARADLAQARARNPKSSLFATRAQQRD